MGSQGISEKQLSHCLLCQAFACITCDSILLSSVPETHRSEDLSLVIKGCVWVYRHGDAVGQEGLKSSLRGLRLRSEAAVYKRSSVGMETSQCSSVSSRGRIRARTAQPGAG